MTHPFIEFQQQILQRLEELTKMNSNKEKRYFDNEIIDNEEFQKLFNISQGTASNWREQGLVAYSQINSKIYYRIADVKKLLKDNFIPSKKK